MKKNIQNILFIAISIAFLGFQGCKKQELAEPKAVKIVNLQIRGSKGKTDTLEFVKGNNVIAQASNDDDRFNLPGIKVSVEDDNSSLIVRLKGHNEILATRKISADHYDQIINCYYDGEKVYGNSVNLKISGYASSGILSVFLDGRLLASGTGTELSSTISLGVDDGKNRQIQVKKQGETAVLLTKEILSDQINQSLAFYYDGTTIFDKIDIGQPVNPANMLLSVKFNSKVSVYQGPADMVVLKEKAGVYTPTSLRIELGADGSFSKAVELPSLSAEAGTNYFIKIVKRGTNDELPYDLTNSTKPTKPESGRKLVTFIPGGSSILVITDEKVETTIGPATRRGTVINMIVADIAQYFK